MCSLSLLPIVRACPARSPRPGWTSSLASVEQALPAAYVLLLPEIIRDCELPAST